MAKKLFAHNSFIGGQVDRELIGKTANAMSYARNVVSSLKGELRARTGTKFLMNLSDDSVVVPFRKDGDDIIALFNTTKLALYDLTDTGIVDLQNGAKPEELKQTWTENTTNGYTVAMNPGLNGSTQAANAYQAFSPGTGLWGWTADYMSDRGWFTFEIAPEKKQMLNKFTITFTSYGLTTDYDKYWGYRNGNLQYSDDGGTTWLPIQTTLQNYQETMITGAVIVPGHGNYGRTWTIKYDLVSNDNTPHRLYRIWFLPETYTRPTNFQDHSVRVQPFLQSNDLQPFSADIELSSQQLHNLKYSQFENKMYLTTYPQIHPKLLAATNNFFSLTDYTPTTPSNFWETNGFPSCVRHFQGRLIFGGYDNFPARITGSKFLDDTNFQVVSSNATAADPIDATCNELKNQIQNIWGGVNALYTLSEDGVAMIDAQGNIIAPDNINFRLKNAVPANGMTPTVKDDIMLYLSANRKRIYIVEYDWNLQRYVINDITKYVQDYLKDEVDELHFAEDKARLIYGSLKSGGWFALLFDKTAGVISIYPFDTAGKVRDIAIVKKDSDYKLLLVVERDRGLVLEEKLPAADLEHFYFQDEDEAQEFSAARIMTNFYMDMVQHIMVDGVGFPDQITFDADALTITTTEENQKIYDLGQQTGCEVYFYDQTTSNTLHVKLAGAVDGQTNVFKVFLQTDSEITTTSTFSTWIKAQTKIIPVLEPDGTEFEIVGDKQYVGKIYSDNNVLTLEKPLWNLFYGLPYEKIGVITETGNPMTRKTWGSVSLVVQDTLHLQIGARQDKLESLIEYKPTGSEYNVVPKMTSGAITKNIADTDEYVKNLILYSDKALPFCVIGLVADGSVSDMGGN
nr:MAG TPA: stabilization protein [Microviridae sp.]